jgi:Lrp/AsnC family transcriptional regulator, leucine-responsive regulatory protein
MPAHSRTVSSYALQITHPLLDEVNLRVLTQLHTHPRLPMTELARRVKLSAPSVTERVRRLEEAGVISGYRLEIDPRALGLPIAAYVRIRPIPGQLAKVAELAHRTPEVVECHRITGEDCFLLKVHVSEVAQLEKLLDKFLLFGTTTTSIVQSSPVPLRPLPLPTTPQARAASRRR